MPSNLSRTPVNKRVFILIGSFILLSLLSCESNLSKSEVQARDQQDWPVYLGDKNSSQYSSLAQITIQNVDQLELAWEYDSTTDSIEPLSQIQCNPLIVEGVLYGSSPDLKFFAIDAATGTRVWEFNSKVDANFSKHVNRGVVYWQKGDDRRILATSGSNLFALNATTGKPIPDFGNDGIVSLKTGLGENAKDSYVVARTPGIVFNNLLIIGSVVSETQGAAPGYIRAFDIITGDLVWTFNTIPKPGEFGYETWPPEAYRTAGGANSWAGMSLDEKRGIVYCPTGSASYDFWGGNRTGENLFANSVIALNADTGERIWHFQTVHHDIWDKDIPAPPNLIEVVHEGERIEALAQITKQGFIFLFNRDTGEPLFPVEETPFPGSDLVGEKTWPTQPVPQLPPPLVPQNFSKELLTNLEEAAYNKVINEIGNFRTGLYAPPSENGTVIFPGFDGGAEWGGAATEPNTGILYVNSNIMPWLQKMIKVDENNLQLTGANGFLQNCAACHGIDRQGDPSGTYPSLLGVSSRLSKDEISLLINTGKGFMPSFKHLGEKEIENIIAYISDQEVSKEHIPERNQKKKGTVPYTHDGYNRYLDSLGYPLVNPPWGTLSAVDMNTGSIKWQVPLGEFKELSEKGIPQTGTENYGGPIVTAGGLLFIGASKDEYFRAFDKETGEELWKYKLPAGGYATPSTYMVNGKQYVVIACGGGKMGTPSGDKYLAFSLSD